MGRRPKYVRLQKVDGSPVEEIRDYKKQPSLFGRGGFHLKPQYKHLEGKIKPGQTMADVLASGVLDADELPPPTKRKRGPRMVPEVLKKKVFKPGEVPPLKVPSTVKMDPIEGASRVTAEMRSYAEMVKKDLELHTVHKVYEIDYVPRPYQMAFEQAMDSGKKRACLVWARRHGKDFACWNYLLMKALEKRGTYFYVFPEYSHGKKVIWQGITESGSSYLEQIPPDLIQSKTETDMRILLKNGSDIQILGSANPDAIRGTNPIGVILSEYAYQNPAIWTHILDPILTKNGGWAVFQSTPNGRNHFFDMCEYAQKNPKEWYFSKVTNAETGFVSSEEIARKKAQGMTEELIRQEYYCDFLSGVQGSYYGRLLQVAMEENRIGPVPYDQNLLVYTAWDIGISDATAIVFFQRRGNQILVIDHYENVGYPVRHYAEHLKGLPYSYGQHFMPHDSRARSAQTGQSYLMAARELGLDVTPIENRVSLMDGIELVRGILPRMYFDSVKCDYLLRCLQQYHADYDDNARVFRNVPKHDWSSHSADAMRMLCLSLETASVGSSMSPEELLKMRQRAGVPILRVGA